MMSFVRNMSKEDKQKMMQAFMNSMTDEEKTEMMQMMMPIAMKNLDENECRKMMAEMDPETRGKLKKMMEACLKTSG